MIQTTTLGRTGLTVSVAGLGCGGYSRLGKAQGKPFEHSVALVRQAMDAGVTFIDTAAAYGTEEIVGAAIKGRRDEVVISTKVGFTTGGPGEPGEFVGPDEIQSRVEGCLSRLGTDVIDILHLHGVGAGHYDHCSTVLLERLERLREQGKIRFTGVTERFASETDHAMSIRATAEAKFDVLMLGINYMNPSALHLVLPQATAKGIGTLAMFVVRGPLGDPVRARALVDRLVGTGEIDPDSFDPADPLGFLTAPGVAGSLAEAAYRFCRHAPGIDVTITGTGNPDHLRHNLDSISGPPLPDAVLAKLDAIFGNVTSESGEPEKGG